MVGGETAGSLANKAARDTTVHCAYELGEEWCKDLDEQVNDTIKRHAEVFSELDQYCIVMQYASDVLISNCKRRKFFAFPFLPKTRPSQTVWLFDKPSDKYIRLWSLPPADTLATLSIINGVASEYQRMQLWCKWFYRPDFHDKIREQYAQQNPGQPAIKLMTEREHLKIVAEKRPESRGEDMSPIISNPFDAARVNPEQAIDPLVALLPKDGNDDARQA